MNVNNLPVGYYKASTTCDYYFFDGYGVNKPNEVKGRMLLIGVYDMTKESQFGAVKYCSSSSYSLEFSDAINCSSVDPMELTIDGQTPELNDRILLKDQENAAENGIYIVTKIGSENEKFELKRASDANAINAMAAGKLVFITNGTLFKGSIFQLMPYDTSLEMGKAEFAFINLSTEGLYANQTYGFRLLGSVCCNQLESINNVYNFACPGFINSDCVRLLKVLVAYDIDLKTIMENLLTKTFNINESSTTCTCLEG